MTHPDYLWAGQGWPMTDDDHEFLVPAFNRIGRHLHGNAWRDDFPALDTLEVKAARAEDASPEERAWAHRLLLALFPETYREDYEEPPPPRLNTFAALGTGRLPPLGGALNALGSSDYSELPQRAPGWWFSEADWSRFRSAIHYKNELQKPKLRMVDAAARWLFNRVVRGEITPFVQHALQGGQWTETTPDDWRMPTPDRLRQRIRYCRMVPGMAAAPSGTHWIILNSAELSAAIEKDSTPLSSQMEEPDSREAEPAPLNGQVGLAADSDVSARPAVESENEQPHPREVSLRFKCREGRPLTEPRDLIAQILIKAFGPGGGKGRQPASRLAAIDAWFSTRENRKLAKPPADVRRRMADLDKIFF